MSDDLVTVLSHQRQVVGTRQPQGVDQIGLGAAFEGGEVDRTHHIVVLCFFGPHRDH